MTELFLTLIIILAFICAVCVIIGIGSKKKAFPVISVCCCVAIAALALSCTVEIKSNENLRDGSETVVTLSGKTEKQPVKTNVNENTEIYKTIKTQTEDNSADRIVYITKTGKKYHYSFDCSSVDFYECTLDEALEMGLEPCGKCVN